MTLIGEHGFSWARNKANLREIKQLLGGKKGIYILTYGEMPMYIGKGKIASRVRGHARKSASKSGFWDHFSWFVVNKAGFENEIEVILLRSLPFFIRSLNRQTGSLGRKNRKKPKDKQPQLVFLPKLGHKKKSKRKANKR